jgi:hypothetical protein
MELISEKDLPDVKKDHWASAPEVMIRTKTNRKAVEAMILVKDSSTLRERITKMFSTKKHQQGKEETSWNRICYRTIVTLNEIPSGTLVMQKYRERDKYLARYVDDSRRQAVVTITQQTINENPGWFTVIT